MHNYRYFKENVDKKEKIDFFKIGRLKESLPFASGNLMVHLTKNAYFGTITGLKNLTNL